MFDSGGGNHEETRVLELPRGASDQLLSPDQTCRMNGWDRPRQENSRESVSCIPEWGDPPPAVLALQPSQDPWEVDRPGTPEGTKGPSIQSKVLND